MQRTRFAAVLIVGVAVSLQLAHAASADSSSQAVVGKDSASITPDSTVLDLAAAMSKSLVSELAQELADDLKSEIREAQERGLIASVTESTLQVIQATFACPIPLPVLSGGDTRMAGAVTSDTTSKNTN